MGNEFTVQQFCSHLHELFNVPGVFPDQGTAFLGQTMAAYVSECHGDLAMLEFDEEKVVEFLKYVFAREDFITPFVFFDFLRCFFMQAMVLGVVTENPCTNFQVYLKKSRHKRLYRTLVKEGVFHG